MPSYFELKHWKQYKFWIRVKIFEVLRFSFILILESCRRSTQSPDQAAQPFNWIFYVAHWSFCIQPWSPIENFNFFFITRIYSFRHSMDCIIAFLNWSRLPFTTPKHSITTGFCKWFIAVGSSRWTLTGNKYQSKCVNLLLTFASVFVYWWPISHV